jgi:hypothetical protein
MNRTSVSTYVSVGKIFLTTDWQQLAMLKV